MPSFNGTITREQLEACIRQAFWENSRGLLSRSAPYILLVGALVAWSMTGYRLPEPGPTFAMIGLFGLAVSAAIWCWGWWRMRREIAALRRANENSAVPPHVAAPLALTMDADGIAWSIVGAPELRPWSTATRIQETRDFLVLHFGLQPQVILPKAGFAPGDLAAIRAELHRRLPET